MTKNLPSTGAEDSKHADLLIANGVNGQKLTLTDRSKRVIERNGYNSKILHTVNTCMSLFIKTALKKKKRRGTFYDPNVSGGALLDIDFILNENNKKKEKQREKEEIKMMRSNDKIPLKKRKKIASIIV